MAAPEGAVSTSSSPASPIEETDDQDAQHRGDVLGDLAAGRPMDRLVCGDVGFGKTEVALRAAFVAAMNGLQVAVVVPTTLLCAPALQDLQRALQGSSRSASRRLSRLVGSKGAGRGQGRPRQRHHRHRRRHARAARQVDRIQAPRPADHRRGAALRRHPQGAAEEDARGRARAHAVGDAHSAHAADWR